MDHEGAIYESFSHSRQSSDILHFRSVTVTSDSDITLPLLREFTNNGELPIVNDSFFDTWSGVVVPTLEFMWSVILFIRFGWVVSEIGIGFALFLIFNCAMSSALTMISISVISSNGIYGGIYTILEYSLGTGMALSITLIYAFGLIAFSSIEIIGSVAGLQNTLKFNIFDSQYLNIVFITNICLLGLFICAFYGSKVMHYTSICFLGILLICFTSIFIGFFTSDLSKISWDQFMQNYYPPKHWNYKISLSYIFPCFTGILTGTNRSSMLLRPSINIPRGGFLSILISTVFYSVLICLLGASLSRSVLEKDEFILLHIAWPTQHLATAGIFLVGLGSALQCIFSCIQVLNSVLESFDLSFKQPLMTPLIVYAFSLLFTLIPELEWMAIIVSMAFLLCYALVNASCLLSFFFPTVSWRPEFQSSYQLSLFGLFWCLILMFQLNQTEAFALIIISIGLSIGCQIYVDKSNWGTCTQGLIYHITLNDLLQRDYMRYSLHHSYSKTSWRPQIIMFLNPYDFSKLENWMSLVDTLTLGTSLSVFCTIISPSDIDNYNHLSEGEKGELFPSQRADTDFLEQIKAYFHAQMKKQECQGFIKVCVCNSSQEGQWIILQTLGIGELTTNTILIEWPLKSDLHSFKKINDAFSLINMGREIGYTCILCKGLTLFPKKSKILSFGNIDIWWIMECNQILILIAFIIQKHKSWKNCKIRLFVLIETENDQIESDILIILKLLRVPIDKIQVFRIRSMSQDQLTPLIRMNILQHSLHTKLLIMSLPNLYVNESPSLQNHLEYMTEGLSRVL